MSSISVLSPSATFHASSSSRGNGVVDFHSRLERAKHQYEHLLLHAGSNLLVDDFSHTNTTAQPTTTHGSLYNTSPMGGYSKAATLPPPSATKTDTHHSHAADYPLPVEGTIIPITYYCFILLLKLWWISLCFPNRTFWLSAQCWWFSNEVSSQWRLPCGHWSFDEQRRKERHHRTTSGKLRPLLAVDHIY